MNHHSKAGWVSDNSFKAMEILKHAHSSGRPVILLTGAGISADSGFPLASQIKEYLVQVREYVTGEEFSNVRQYIEEARWPSRHDLRVDLMLQLTKKEKTPILQLDPEMITAERKATQEALIAELRRHSPTIAFSLQEIFNQLDGNLWNHDELDKLYGEVAPFAKALGQRSPKNVAYRSLLFHLCDNNQATIDACFDHFIRDRTPTTTHQFIYFFTRILRVPVIFTTNFDPFLEMAFAGEGLLPRVYEVRGEGSIPSARLLLSQPLSIVKLHGGAHQMQTGFNLDDPLSPTALASFTELYEQLRKTYGQSPLTVVIGYGGSDRRVMDIVAARIREWRIKKTDNSDESNNPSVLWISRDPWKPELLKSAVNTHPDILQRGTENNASSPYPAHLIRYRDGRLFLLEALQCLLKHFPIARSHYQAVNFVPHSVAGKDRSSQNAGKFDEDWRIALIHTDSGGGSSSTLVEVAEKFELKDYRTLWIDLTEVAGLPALIDLVSERISKLDTRLQPVRRPPLLRSLLQNYDKMEQTPFAKASSSHEFRTCIQWLRLALRRGKYLLALDSLDEFPSEHPALEALTDNASNRKQQRILMCRLIKELAAAPELIGDSRVAIALSSNSKKNPANHLPAQDDSRCLYSELTEYLEDQRRARDGICVPSLESAEQIPTDLFKAFHDLVSPEHEKNGQASPKQRLIKTTIILISCCARRIRSEVLLRRCVAEYIGRLWPERAEHDLSLDGISFVEKPEPGTKIFSAGPQSPFDALWKEPGIEAQHRNAYAKDEDDEDILQGIKDFSGHGRPQGKGLALDKDTTRQWLYRTEGGYHWMHRDIRNTIYEGLKSGENFAALAMAHHVIALFCYDELYERSRDARAFLEYLFHRIAAIHLAIEDDKCVCAKNWVIRLLIALHREKHALMTRVRLPGFLWQMTQLRAVISKLDKKLIEKNQGNASQEMIDLLRLLADFFLASGHPHSALSDSLKRLSLEDTPLTLELKGICNAGDFAKIRGFVRALYSDLSDPDIKVVSPAVLTALRDVAYSCHDPLLSTAPFPVFPSSKKILPRYAGETREHSNENGKDWVTAMDLDGTPASRQERIDLCKEIYSTIAATRYRKFAGLDALEPWIEHNEIMDLFGGIVRKVLEFQFLLNNSSSWIDSSKVYLSKSPQALADLEKFTASQNINSPPEWSSEVEQMGDTPLLRRSGKRQRHECYRLCLKARIEAAGLFISRTPEELKLALIKDQKDKLPKWNVIRRRLTDAESILNRAGGPADRQAMAITRLTDAELLVRRAELSRWAQDAELSQLTKNADSKKPDLRLRQESLDDIKKLQLEGEKHLDEAFATLSTVEQLMNEGRGENRWRFFYLLTLGRAHLLRAYTKKEYARRSALNDMTWAARHFSGALNNCGLWTDRYDVLLWWWDVWKEVAKAFHHPHDDSGYTDYLKTMYARLGIRWGDETSAKRSGRQEPDQEF